jgi:hypothetical protein
MRVVLKPGLRLALLVQMLLLVLLHPQSQAHHRLLHLVLL